MTYPRPPRVYFLARRWYHRYLARRWATAPNPTGYKNGARR